MATSASIEQQMSKIMKKSKAYTPANASDVYSDLASRVNFYKPQYEELAGMEQQAYAAPATQMKDYYAKYGGEKAMKGPSALSQLYSIMQDIGRQYGTMGALRGGITTQKGKLEDMSKTVLDQYQARKGALLDQYNMLQPLYSAAINREEAARSRAAAASEAKANADRMAAYLRELEKQNKTKATPTASKAKLYNVQTLADTPISKGVNQMKIGGVGLGLPADMSTWNPYQQAIATAAGLIAPGGSNILKAMPSYIKSQGGLLNYGKNLFSGKYF